MNYRTHIFAIACIGMALGSSCGVYSFKGISLSSEVQTITIEQFYSNASLGPSDMADILSDRMRLYFQQNTSLTFLNNDADLLFTGYVSSYTLSPVAPSEDRESGLDYGALTRLEIEVVASYANAKDNQYDFTDRSFSFFIDFDQNTQSFPDNERAFVEEIFEQIIRDIFAAALANW